MPRRVPPGQAHAVGWAAAAPLAAIARLSRGKMCGMQDKIDAIDDTGERSCRDRE